MGAELFHEDGQKHRQKDRQTNMTKLMVAFCKFAFARKKIVNTIDWITINNHGDFIAARLVMN